MSTRTRAVCMCTLAQRVMQTCFALDQEPDDVIFARRCSGKALEKTSRGDIIGFAGDTVREPPLYQLCTAFQPLQLLIPVPLHPILCSFATLFRKPTFRTARFKLATSWAPIQSQLPS